MNNASRGEQEARHGSESIPANDAGLDEAIIGFDRVENY
jgi:hypothetical protein